MSVFGLLASAASLGIVLFGLPKQIYRNYSRKNCEGLDPWLVYTVTSAYVLWALYGFTKPDWFIVVPQVPGVVLSAILIFQIIYYKRKSPDRKQS